MEPPRQSGQGHHSVEVHTPTGQKNTSLHNHAVKALARFQVYFVCYEEISEESLTDASAKCKRIHMSLGVEFASAKPRMPHRPVHQPKGSVMKRSISTFWLILFLGMLCSPVIHGATSRIRVLLLDGESGGPYHNWQVTTPILKKELEDTGLFDVTVATAPHSDGDFSKFKPDFRLYQVVVSNLDSSDWPSELKAHFEQYMRDGGRSEERRVGKECRSRWSPYH